MSGAPMLDSAAEDRRWMTRTLGGLYIMGGLVGFAWLALARVSETNVVGMAAACGTAVLAGLALHRAEERLGPWLQEAGLAFGTLLVTAALFFNGSANMSFGYLYVWGAPYAAWFLGRAAAARQVLLVGACLAGFLALAPTASLPLGESVMRWTIVVGTAVVIDVLVLRLSEALRAGNERSRRDRALLRESEARYRSIVQAAGEGVWVRDTQLRTTFVNPRMADMLGLRPEEMVGRPVRDFIVPEELSKAEEHLRAQEQGVAVHFDARYRHADGSAVSAIVSATPLHDDEGRLTGSLAMVADITERKAAEEALARAERRFHALLDSAPDAIVAVNGQGRVVLANARTHDLTGYEPDELIGRPAAVLVSKQRRAEYAERWRRYLAGDRLPPVERELVIRRRDGTEFPSEIAASRLELEDGEMLLAAIRDITVRKQAEETRQRLEARLHQSERMESLGRLAGGIAHDFNNLLAVILNYAHFVRGELDDAHPVARDVEEIEGAASRAAALTRELLLFSRADAARLETVHLNDSIGELERLLARTLGEDITLRSSLAPRLWPVIADSNQIQQVLANLALNARDAMPDGGSLTIETANVETPGGAGGGTDSRRLVEISVSDTGLGMAEEVVSRAFEPFFTTKSKGEGTGLGLATVHGIVKGLAGNVALHSSPGQGTTVVVRLPAAAPAQDRTAPPARAPAAGQGETVLLVEDEPAVRRMTQRILSAGGYRVIEAADGQQACTLPETDVREVDLLLTDVIMPVASGPELAQALRERRPDLPVLYMSGYPAEVLSRSGVDERSVVLVHKPFKAEELLHAVRAVLDGRSGGRPLQGAPDSEPAGLV